MISFHKEYLNQLGMHNIDSRPAAVDGVRELVSTGGPTKRVIEWLSTQLDQPQLLIKDPHAFWFVKVWADACAELDVNLRWLTALRHPAEVVGSRDLAYLQDQSDELRLVKETSNVAGWVHAALLTEKAGRGGQRSFIRYVDLIADWRKALAPVQQHLTLEFNTDLSSASPHDVDGFLEASLRKSQLGWDNISVPPGLQQMAEEVWQLLGRLVDDPQNEGVRRRMDEIHDAYRKMYAEASALTFDYRRGEAKLAAREVRQKQQETIRKLRQGNQRKRERIERLEAIIADGSRHRRGVRWVNRLLHRESNP